MVLCKRKEAVYHRRSTKQEMTKVRFYRTDSEYGFIFEVAEKQEQEAVVSARKKLKNLLQNGKGDTFKYEIL